MGSNVQGGGEEASKQDLMGTDWEWQERAPPRTGAAQEQGACGFVMRGDL